MSHTFTIRLTEEVAEWLVQASKRTGLPRGRIILQCLEHVKSSSKGAFMQLAGVVSGDRNLSKRKGFSRS